ncbi:hypothetical protein Pmar_PMAR027649 [Perkinsus marinus ATCC 50983]|uniref:C2H2-type domain-containing protein n=1 Tax=Perkinsus marinus (strain ATCC 50983 / TXsc) TaxID=423536 RepID=C5KCC0_PERM5|nr:hypothetical protein Pmar_PMAR027649 [Perkinsus marinus ATCC 50983]EER17933.1 hypothetical protein Pmar_PMAR027649 [Perkinsus marinus ATCC 50983]|eukprot:XP_002786137.1 hypothetical protein Pmar_PMAR027649 [Perkinsus marinus ATCC 50983]
MSICVQKSDKSSERFSNTIFEEVSSVASALGIYAILRSELIVKSEMVDDEVDYRQPDEDQLSLVDLCSSDEEPEDGEASQDYIEPTPLRIPVRRWGTPRLGKIGELPARQNNQYKGFISGRTETSSYNSTSQQASDGSTSSAAVVDFDDHASTPSTYCPSDIGSPRVPTSPGYPIRSAPNLGSVGLWNDHKCERRRKPVTSANAILRPTKPSSPPNLARIGLRVESRGRQTRRPVNTAVVLKRAAAQQGRQLGDRCDYDDPECPLPKVPRDWDETDQRFACKDCIQTTGDDSWICTLCGIDLWSPGEIAFHETTKRHQKAAGHKVWENMEAYIKEKYSKDLNELGVLETAAQTLLCKICDMPLQSYYDAAKHVNSSNHFGYSQHYAWWLDARAIFTGGDVSSDTQWRAVTTYLLKHMPDPKRLIDEEGIIPMDNSSSIANCCFRCDMCGAKLDCLSRVQEHVASRGHLKKKRWNEWEAEVSSSKRTRFD